MSISMQIIHPGQLLTPAIRLKQLLSLLCAISVLVFFLSEKAIVSRLYTHSVVTHAPPSTFYHCL